MCVCELKEDLRKLYLINFPQMKGQTNTGINKIEGDITKVPVDQIPAHDILCAGFPCQPFSQAGKRQGFKDEKDRGNLFFTIRDILRYHRPRFVLLENVANLEGHDDGNTWKTIHEILEGIDYRGEGLNYKVKKAILSPHQYGIPQHRKRIYIVCERGDYGNIDSFSFPPIRKNAVCNIHRIIDINDRDFIPLKIETRHQIDVWEQFIKLCVEHKQQVPSFPIWAMEFGADYDYKELAPAKQKIYQLRGKRGKLGRIIRGRSKIDCLSCLPIYAQTDSDDIFPDWKIRYIEQNREFYRNNKEWLDIWLRQVQHFENSHLKLEWNCGYDTTMTLQDKILQFRASGIRAKLATFSPALNLVGTQIPILPWINLPEGTFNPLEEPDQGRYMSRKECALLQGMKDLRFGNEDFELSVPRSYAALGNAVNVTIVKHIAKRLLKL